MRNNLSQTTVTHFDMTDIPRVARRIQNMRKQLAEKEGAASQARIDLEQFEQRARQRLHDRPNLLDELEALLAELTRHDEELQAHEARMKALRK